MKIFLLFAIACFACACNEPQGETKTSTDSLPLIDTNHKKQSIVVAEKINNNNNNALVGIWTDGTTENTTINISKDSIFYIDQFTSYKYELTGNTIKIDYPDNKFIGEVSFLNDTLIISAEGDTTKYWKFKD